MGDSNGFSMIVDNEECEAAAEFLGLSDTTSYECKPSECGGRPYGCIYDVTKYDWLGLVSPIDAQSPPGPCGVDHPAHDCPYKFDCICRKDDKTTTQKTTKESEKTTKFSTTLLPTTTATSNYDCMDISIDQCNDETLHVIDTLPMNTHEDCHELCNTVFHDACKSYIYYSETKICSVLEDHFNYLYGCSIYGAEHDTIYNCLQDDVKYPDMCKTMIESECTYNGKVLLEEDNIYENQDCLNLNELIQGQYYVFDEENRSCKVYDSNDRTCIVHRGINGILPSDCPN